MSIKRFEHQQNGKRLVGLSIYEAAIRNQTETAERRAEHRCTVHDESNTFWKRVGMLIGK